jgi:NADPH-dependent F420 reductase
VATPSGHTTLTGVSAGDVSMRIALLGGTGDIGEGLAVRWGRDTAHELLIGSRDPERAREAADAYQETVADHGGDADIAGYDNTMAADRADVAVLAVPPYHVSRPRRGCHATRTASRTTRRA